MDSISDFSISELTPRSSPILFKAGATMDDDTGDMKVKDDTIRVAAHFFLYVQFLGFSGSSASSHVTCAVIKIDG